MYEVNNYLCNYCSRVFTCKLSLQRHMLVYKNNCQFNLPCCQEPFQWADWKSLATHNCDLNVAESLIDCEEKDEVFCCDGCAATFSYRHMLKRHILKYPDRHNFQCKSCNKCFKTDRGLARHLCLLRNGDFLCSCSTFFKTLQDFKAHVGLHRPYVCCVCKRKSATLNNLINHIRTHTQEKPYSCNVCSQKFKVREALTLHIKIHSGIKSFHCSKCSFSSTTKWSLLIHEKRHNPLRDEDKRFSCNECNKSFYLKHHLQAHIVSIHSENKSHLCRVCGKMFSLSSSLKKHLEIHDRDCEKGKKCKICGQEFLKTELYNHHKEKGHFQFACNPCGKVFFSRFNLKRHCKSYHDGKE